MNKNTQTKNKTGRKNNTGQLLTWPSVEFFTQKDLEKTNPTMVRITLRTKYKKQIGSKIKEIGVLHNGKGRPTNVYAMIPVNASTIDKAKTAGVILHTEYLAKKVADITSNAPTVTTPAPTIPVVAPVTEEVAV